MRAVKVIDPVPNERKPLLTNKGSHHSQLIIPCWVRINHHKQLVYQEPHVLYHTCLIPHMSYTTHVLYHTSSTTHVYSTHVFYHTCLLPHVFYHTCLLPHMSSTTHVFYHTCLLPHLAWYFILVENKQTPKQTCVLALAGGSHMC